MITVDTLAAAWIRDVVLPAAYRKATVPPALCACQYGMCGLCQEGRHQQCAVVAWGGAPRAQGETHLTDARGMVIGPEVWLSGRPCRWVCSCGCAPVGAERPPTGPTPPIQLDLFAAFTAA